MYEKKKDRALYLEIEESIKSRIRSKEFKAGDKIMSESQICAEYSVSRITAVRALNDLESGGYIRRVPGKGNFVCYFSTMMRGSKFYSFSEYLSAQGYAPSSETLSGEICQVGERDTTGEIRRATFWGPEERVVHIKRLRKADGVPVAISETFIPLYQMSADQRKRLPEMTYSEINALMYSIMRAAQTQLQRIAEETTAVVLPKEDCLLLELPQGTPVVKNRRTTFAEETVLECTFFYQKSARQLYQPVFEPKQ